MRRKHDSLITIEVRILACAIRRASDGVAEFHGFELAQLLAADAEQPDSSDARQLVAHGTLYKALARLADRGLLESRWEDPDAALAAGRPRRRLYRVTPGAAQALATAMSSQSSAPYAARSLGIQPS